MLQDNKTEMKKKLVTWGDHMAYNRRKAGMTQEQLAEKSGISVSTIRKMEADMHIPKLDTVVWAAMVLGITVDEYIGNNGGNYEPV